MTTGHSQLGQHFGLVTLEQKLESALGAPTPAAFLNLISHQILSLNVN